MDAGGDRGDEHAERHHSDVLAASSLLSIGGRATPGLPFPAPGPPFPPFVPPPAAMPARAELKTGFRGKSASLVPLPETELLANPVFAKADADRARPRRASSGRARAVRKDSGSMDTATSPGQLQVILSSGYGKLEFAKGSEPEGMRPHVYKPRVATALANRRAKSMNSVGRQFSDSDSDPESAGGTPGPDNESSRIVRRRERNALAAQRSRERKRLYTEKLEIRISELEAYATALESTIRALGGSLPSIARPGPLDRSLSSSQSSLGHSQSLASTPMYSQSFAPTHVSHPAHLYSAPATVQQAYPTPHPESSLPVSEFHQMGNMEIKMEGVERDPVAEAVAQTTSRLEAEFASRFENEFQKRMSQEIELRMQAEFQKRLGQSRQSPLRQSSPGGTGGSVDMSDS